MGQRSARMLASSRGGLLIVRVQGGLCNRLQALFSSAVIARETRRAFAYEWPLIGGFEADVRDLLHVEHLRRLPTGTSRLPAKLTGGYRLHKLTERDLQRRFVPIISGHALGPWIEEFRSVRPTEVVRRRVDRVRAEWGPGPRIGVAIRAHSDAHELSKEHSPPAWFYERMAQLEAERPGVRWFLSSDTSEVSAEVHRRFGNVAELDGKSPHNSALGVQDALCDLYLLGACDHVVGSVASSMSKTAGMLAGSWESSLGTDW